jgi:photosystem II stability/assembly factor-like uncharacterized protein
MKRILLILFVLSNSGYTSAQSNPKDTLDKYSNQFNEGNLTLNEYDSIMSSYFHSLGVDAPTTSAEKYFNRNLAFWKDRMYISPSGIESKTDYISSLNDYLENQFCGDANDGEWSYAFGNNPTSVSALGSCVEAGGHTNGIVTAVYMNPSSQNIILAGSGSSGIWYTDDAGANWKNVTDNLKIPFLGIREILDISKPSEPAGSVLLAITGVDRFYQEYVLGAGILKSVDGGKTWSRITFPEEDGYIPYLVDISKPIGSTDIVFAASQTKVYKSINRGSTWTILSSQPTLALYQKIYSIATSDLANDIIYVSTGRIDANPEAQIFKSSMSSISWQEINDDFAAFDVDLKTAIGNYHSINFDETEFFDEAYNLLTPLPGYNGAVVPVYYDLTFAECDLSEFCVKSDPIIYWTPADGMLAHSATQQKLLYEFDIPYFSSGNFQFYFDADIPAGAEIHVYTLSPTKSLIREYVGTGSGMESYSFNEPLEIPFDMFNAIQIEFRYPSPAYDIFADPLPSIYLKDFRIKFSRDYTYTGTPPYIGIGEPVDGESYALFQSNINNPTVYFLKTEDNGSNWSVIYADFEEALSKNRQFITGHGVKEGIYQGGLKFARLNLEEGLYQKYCSVHDDVRSIQIVDNVDGVNRIIVGDDGGISYSDDNGETWGSLNGNGLRLTQLYGLGVNQNDPNKIISGGVDNGTFLRDETGWNQTYGGDGGHAGFSSNASYPNLHYYHNNKSIKTIDLDEELDSYTFSTTSNGMSWFFKSANRN